MSSFQRKAYATHVNFDPDSMRVELSDGRSLNYISFIFQDCLMRVIGYVNIILSAVVELDCIGKKLMKIA